MTDPVMTGQFEYLLGEIKQRIERWRSAVKGGGILSVTMDCQWPMAIEQPKPRMIENPVRSFAELSYQQLDDLADMLDCIWAMDPRRRLYYFIPKELTGDRR